MLQIKQGQSQETVTDIFRSDLSTQIFDELSFSIFIYLYLVTLLDFPTIFSFFLGIDVNYS